MQHGDHSILDDFLSSRKLRAGIHDEDFHRALDDHLTDTRLARTTSRSLQRQPAADVILRDSDKPSMLHHHHHHSQIDPPPAIHLHDDDDLRFHHHPVTASRLGHHHLHHHHPPHRHVHTVVQVQAPPPPVYYEEPLPPPPERPPPINIPMVLAAIFMTITVGLLGVAIGTTEWYVVSQSASTRQSFSIFGTVNTQAVRSGVESSVYLNYWSATCAGGCIGVVVPTCEKLSADTTSAGKWFYAAACTLGGATLAFVVLAIVAGLISLICTIGVVMNSLPWWMGIPGAFLTGFFTLIALLIYGPWLGTRAGTDYVTTAAGTHNIGYSYGIAIGAMFTAIIAGILMVLGSQSIRSRDEEMKRRLAPRKMMMQQQAPGYDLAGQYEPERGEFGYQTAAPTGVSVTPRLRYQDPNAPAPASLLPGDGPIYPREMDVDPVYQSGYASRSGSVRGTPRTVTSFPAPHDPYDYEVDRLGKSYAQLQREAALLQEEACRAVDAAETAECEAEEMRNALSDSELKLALMEKKLNQSAQQSRRRDILLGELERNLTTQQDRALKASHVLDHLHNASNDAVKLSHTAADYASARSSPLASPRGYRSPRLYGATSRPRSPLGTAVPVDSGYVSRPSYDAGSRTIRTPQQWRAESADLFSHHSQRLGQA